MHKILTCFILCSLMNIAFSNTIEQSNRLQLDLENLWETTSEQFYTENQASSTYHHWPYSNNTSDLFYSSTLSKIQLYFLGMDIPDATLRFRQNRLHEAIITVYNKRDQQHLPPEYLSKFSRQVENKLRRWIKTDTTKTLLITDASRGPIKRVSWANDKISITLQAYADKHGLHYAQIRITKPAVHKASKPTSPTLPIHNLNGDVLIENLPVAHQVRSGYCAPATAEILARYFGNERTVHEMASVLDTDPENGTSSKNICTALNNIVSKHNLYSKLQYEFKDLKQFEKMVSQYNSYAVKQNIPTVEFSFINNGSTRVCNLPTTLANMDFKTYKKFKTHSQRAEMESFFTTICDSIDAGLPAAWSLINGLNTETDNTSVVGHICVVSGYNKATRELIITDPKGVQGRNKRVSLEDAWTSNVGLYIFIQNKKGQPWG